MMEEIKAQSGTLETPADTGLTPSGVVKRWMLEIKLADKQEAEWRKDATEAIEIYEGKKQKAHSFNILWANTETLRPALYNSLPQPDVRKRWDDKDEAGQIASDMMEKALVYCLDAYGADSIFKLCALDACLSGRAVARVRYVPAFTDAEGAEPEAQEQQEGAAEELAYEQVVCEHVHWSDFRRGPGKTWDEVTWIAFRHRLTREQLTEKFGEEIGSKVEMDSAEDEDVKKVDDEAVANIFKTVEVWELWDKDERKVHFICPTYSAGPLSSVDDPLGLLGFFPIPEPLNAIENPVSLVPTVPYSLYKPQAEELNTISERVNKITSAMKYRGAYNAKLGEIANVTTSPDNTLVPISSDELWDNGGFDKHIWMWPVDDAAKALTVLEGQREACKQVIYEITGISDIVRGASNASETATAQQLKANFGTLRLQRFQREVQRFVRDIIRLMGEVIAERFQPETLSMLSGVQLPTMEQVQAHMQQVMVQAQMTGQPMPQMEMPVTLEQVMEILRSDMLRSYRIDIETDSTIEALDQANQKAVADLIQSLGTMAQALIPVVDAGLMPKEAVQQIVKSIVIRTKLGRAVEDALDQEPEEQGPSPEVQQAMQEVQQAQQQVEQKADEVGKQQQQVQAGQMKLAADKQVAQLQLENERMKLDHAAEIHRMATQQAGNDLLNQVSQMLADHEHKLRTMFAPMGGGNA